MEVVNENIYCQDLIFYMKCFQWGLRVHGGHLKIYTVDTRETPKKIYKMNNCSANSGH